MKVREGPFPVSFSWRAARINRWTFGDHEDSDLSKIKSAQKFAEMEMLDEIHAMLRHLVDRMPQPVINVDVGEMSRNRNNRISKMIGSIDE